MYIRLQSKYWLLLIVLCLWVAESNAKTPKFKSSVEHYIGLSVGGGEANDVFAGTKDVKSLAGGAANAMVSYELQANRFIFMVGLQAQYQHTRDTVAPFVDAFGRRDIMGNVEYQYVYSHWQDKHTDVRFAVPIRIGYQINDYLYVLAGADLSCALWTTHSTSAEMFTQGLHAWDSRPIRSDEHNDFSNNLGYYLPMELSTTAPYREALWVAPSLEIGSYIPVKWKSSRLRAGVYMNYGFRLGERSENTIVDYSAVSMSSNPNTQQPAYLQEKVLLNTALNSDKPAAVPANLEVGVRLTYLMNVTIHKSHCMCVKSFYFK